MLEDVNKRIKYLITSRGWDGNAKQENLAKSISIEAAELLELYQWSSDADPDRVKEELADVLIYSLQLAMSYDFDIIDIINEKLDLNEKRFPIP